MLAELIILTGIAAPSPAATPPQVSPAAGQQVATGARASERSAVPLHQFLADHNWLALEAALDGTSDPDANFYRGILDDRLGRYQESIDLLLPLIPQFMSGDDPLREKQGRLALANDYFRTFRYKDAADQYTAIERCCANLMSANERSENEDAMRLLPLLAHAPPQTLHVESDFSVPIERDALGLLDVSVWVDGYAARWLFDPAASFTMLSHSQAKLVGLRLSEGTITLTNITGKPIIVHATVIPQLKLGAALFRNVPAVVYEDADLFNADRQYQIEGVLAQPLLAALGQITISDDDHLSVSQETSLKEGAPFFSDGQRLIVSGSDGSGQLYALDPGSRGSQLTSRYYDAHASAFAQCPMKLVKMQGADGAMVLPICSADEVTVAFGRTEVTFHEIPVLAQPAGAEVDRFWGTLRADALEQLASYTFDFRSMRFLAKTHPER